MTAWSDKVFFFLELFMAWSVLFLFWTHDVSVRKTYTRSLFTWWTKQNDTYIDKYRQRQKHHIQHGFLYEETYIKLTPTCSDMWHYYDLLLISIIGQGAVAYSVFVYLDNTWQYTLLSTSQAIIFSIVGSLRDLEVACSASGLSNPVSGGQCHLNHLTILRRLS